MRKYVIIILALVLAFSCIYVNAIDISAKSGVVIEANTGRVLFGKNENQRLPMASTTKIMTALIALEQPNLDEEFVVDENAIKVEGSSMGLVPGSIVTLRDLVYGMMLASGNDAANAAAVRIAGDIPSFVALMNKKAKEIGLNDTNFVTPSGLDDENHYSTALDMAKLGAYAIKNPVFLEIASTKKKRLEYGNPKMPRTLFNHNRLLSEYEGAIGIKTGFTKKSGRCLVSAAERDGVTLVAVTLKAPNDWSDHKKMLDFGFSQAVRIPLDNQKSYEINVVGDGNNKKMTAREFAAPTAPILQEQVKDVKKQVVIAPFYYAPLKEGAVVGEVVYTLSDIVIERQALVV